MSNSNPVVSIIMGSDSDWPVMEAASEILRDFDIEHEVEVVSAHRTPEAMMEFAKQAASRGIKVIIAGAGGAAHLPGMVASLTTLPVIGVPVPLKYLDGMDSLLSIVQMPGGIPVATVGVGNAKNAGLLAARILGLSDPSVNDEISKYMESARQNSLEKSASLKSKRNHKTGFSA
ncbi:MAG: 5-(carboxyamino)imidazole ribonucleotide mutase [Actinomycetes bacterium]